MSLTNALNISKTGLYLLENSMSVVAQNLATREVDAYKEQYIVAQDLGYSSITEPGSSTSANTTAPVGVSIGMGVKLGGVYRSFRQGDPIITDNPLDFMILGRGFYQIQMPDGTTSYTRAGVFQKNSQGQLVTVDGYPVLPTITIPANAMSVNVSNEGVVEVTIQGQQAAQNIGQLQLANFINPNGLKAIGKNLFLETEASGTPTISNPDINGVGSIAQGQRESSNVNPIEAITSLIKIQRSYENLTKAIQTADHMYEAANRMGG